MNGWHIPTKEESDRIEYLNQWKYDGHKPAENSLMYQGSGFARYAETESDCIDRNDDYMIYSNQCPIKDSLAIRHLKHGEYDVLTKFVDGKWVDCRKTFLENNQ